MVFPRAYYYSRPAATAELLFVLLFFCGMCWLLSKITLDVIKSANWIVWLIAVFNAALLLLYLVLGRMLIRRLITTAPSLLLTAFGLTDSASNVGEIEWADIKEACLYNAGRGGTTVTLTLLNSDKYQARLTSIARMVKFNWLSKAQLNLSLSGTNAKADEILAIIKSQIV